MEVKALDIEDHMDEDAYLDVLRRAVDEKDIGKVSEAGLNLTKGLKDLLPTLDPSANNKLAQALETSWAGPSIYEDLSLLSQTVTDLHYALTHQNIPEILKIVTHYNSIIRTKPLLYDACELSSGIFDEDSVEKIEAFSKMAKYLGNLGKK